MSLFQAINNVIRRVIGGGSSSVTISANDTIVTFLPKSGTNTIILPSESSINDAIVGGNGNPFSVFNWTITIEDNDGNFPVEIYAPTGKLINGSPLIVLTKGSVNIFFNGTNFTALVSPQSLILDFTLTKEKMLIIPKTNPTVLVPANANAFIDVEGITLNVTDGTSSYDGGALRFGYMDNLGHILEIVRDAKPIVFSTGENVITVANETVNHIAEFRLDNIGMPPITGASYKANPETFSSFYSAQTIKNKSLVSWLETPPSNVGNAAQACIRVKVTYGIPKMDCGGHPCLYR